MKMFVVTEIPRKKYKKSEAMYHMTDDAYKVFLLNEETGCLEFVGKSYCYHSVIQKEIGEYYTDTVTTEHFTTQVCYSKDFEKTPEKEIPECAILAKAQILRS